MGGARGVSALLLCEVTLADAGGLISGSLWGASTKSAGALQAALDAAPSGKWPAVKVEKVILRIVGYLHGEAHIRKLEGSDATKITVVSKECGDLKITPPESIVVADFQDLWDWKAGRLEDVRSLNFFGFSCWGGVEFLQSVVLSVMELLRYGKWICIAIIPRRRRPELSPCFGRFVVPLFVCRPCAGESAST